ncbi:phospholipase A1-like [Brevipalpus obovatus]|uniref:phospholipase A1-like n=1 Tax=Brevipalpus obovatus TaxID=246614 RepID=UPI003D9E36F1
MFSVLLLSVLPLVRSQNFDYPIGGPERADPINPQVFFPCLTPVYDPEYGKFDPVLYPNFPVTLPPISACPELVNKGTIRFLAISKKNPTVITSVKNIKPGSKVAIYIHGYMEEHDSVLGTAAALATLRENDWAVLVDWDRLAFSRVIGRIRIPLIALFLTATNPILVGRVTCKFIKFLNVQHGVRIEDILIVGFSFGANTLGFIADYCREKYRIQLNDIVGIELTSVPFRNSNYALANYTSAKFFDVIFSTKSTNIPVVDQVNIMLGHLGYFEVVADCAYYANPERLLLEQEPCVVLPATSFCSHFFGMQVFLSAYSGRCLYHYGPCPDIVGVPSNQEIGYTRLNCADHPFLQRTCIRTTSNPVKSC